MRVNPNMVPDILNGIQTTKQQVQTALTQLTTGRRVNNPLDDPSVAASMVQNQLLSGAVDQYTRNVNGILSMMQTADAALSATVTSMTQAITVGTEGGTGTTTPTQRQALAQQVRGILDSVLSNSNATYNGIYLFGGTETTKPPYAVDATSTTGYTYTGNDNTNQAEIGVAYSVQTNLPGSQIFSNSGADVLGSLNALATALESGTATDVQNATSQVQDALRYFNQQRTFFGTVMAQLNSQENFLSQETLTLKTQQTTLVGADPTQAAAMLAQAQTSNNAIMAAAAKVLPNTLLDYLR